MAYYDFMVEPFAKCIEAGFTKIDEVFPEDLKEKVINFLVSKGLGPDGKPLAKEPKKPVEEKKEDTASKDTKEDGKAPTSEDKGAK